MTLDEQYKDTLQRDPDFLDRNLTEKEAAAFIGYTPRALQSWRLKGGGPKFVKVSARSIRYRRRELLKWANERLVASTSQHIGEI